MDHFLEAGEKYLIRKQNIPENGDIQGQNSGATVSSSRPISPAKYPQKKAGTTACSSRAILLDSRGKWFIQKVKYLLKNGGKFRGRTQKRQPSLSGILYLRAGEKVVHPEAKYPPKLGDNQWQNTSVVTVGTTASYSRTTFPKAREKLSILKLNIP